MMLALLAVFVLVAVFLAVYFISRQKAENSSPPPEQVIHTSGIYSIVRQSPRKAIAEVHPTEKEIRQYLREQFVDSFGNPLNDADRRRILALWQANLERSISEIENGDFRGCEFYAYEFEGEDKLCSKTITTGTYITREDIFHNPALVPPFHAGCRVVLKSTRCFENGTGEQAPFITDESPKPALPDWKTIVKPE